MNNFRNPYVNPDSFQGKVYDYYRNPTKPNSIHFSVDNQEGPEQKGIQQSQKNNKYRKTKTHSIYTNHQFEKVNDSKPVMFSPPNVDSIQKPLNETTVDDNYKSENEKMDKKEAVSNLIKEFSLMLDDTPSIHEGFKTLPESEFEYDSLLNAIESTSIPENILGNESTNDTDYKNVTDNHVLTKYQNSEMLFNEFHSMLDEHIDHLKYDEENTKLLNENKGIMEGKFFSMLSESDELQEVNQDLREEVEIYNDSTEDKFFKLFLESNELQEDKQGNTTNEADIETVDENIDTLEDKYYTMLLINDDELQEEKLEITKDEDDIDTLKENTDMLENQFFTMLLESDELQEEKQDSFTIEKDIEMLNENTDTMEDKFLTLLSESDELEKEKPDSSFANMKEKKSDEIEELSKDELHLCHENPPFKKKNKRKYCINKNKSFHIACLKEVDDESFFLKNTHLIDLVEKKNSTTVMMPVLLTRLETEVDIFETIDLLMPLDNILKVEWAVQSLDCKSVLPSKTVFLKGEFIAEITFSNKELGNTIQTLKISIPWKKTENINWISIPDFPYSTQKEFLFNTQHEHNSDFHFEAYEKFAEPIRSQLKQVNFVWHQELNSKEKHLQVNGIARLSIHFMQEQFIELDCYS